MGQLEILNPTAEARTTDLPLARRTAELGGKTIGFLNNRKANAGLLLEKVEAILRARLGQFSRVNGEKNASLPAPDEVLTRLAHCDAAVVAIGD
jgi:hypothetical protein